DDPERFFRAAVIAVGAWIALHVLHLLYPPGLERNEVLLGSFAGLTLGWVGWTAAAVGFAVAFATLGVVAGVLIARRSMRPEAMVPFGLFLTPAVLAMVLIFA
ncbi:MAG: hypothetical protein HKN26_07170, partial [Acidimicrobiales bacterium]|nr:hypothetical protein [Acidimicrobiales bacterium]